MHLPESIRLMTAGLPYQTDSTGLSGSQVLIYPDRVLKIQPQNAETRKERQMFEWLQGKLPVPRLLAYEEQDGKSYLLMSKCAGEMACSETYMRNPKLQSKLLADGLKRLWQVDVTGCPVDRSLSAKLEQAKQRVEDRLVDAHAAHINGFATPEEMMRWLVAHQPTEQLVLSHGDYCLPNVFFAEDALSGYIDIGQSGLADPWYDIALCHRSLVNNFTGVFGKSYPGLDETLLFKELNLEPDWEKIRYYLLLDDLF